MANKIYVGQEGAQELYRRVKSLIPAVDQELDENSANPISNRAVTNAFKKFGGFRKVNGTGADNHPDVQNPDTKVIYLVEDPNVPNPDHFYEWIWEVPAEGNPIWRCIGTATVDLEDYYTKDEVNALLDEKLDIDDFHDTTYTAGNGLTLTDTEFKVTPDNADDGYFTTKSNQVVWIPDQFVTIAVPDPVVPTRSLRIQFDDPTFDLSTYEWPAVTDPSMGYNGKLGSSVVSNLGNGVWDVCYDNTDWDGLFQGIKSDRFTIPSFSVIGGDLTGVTSIRQCFWGCDLVTNFSGVSNADALKLVTYMFMASSSIVDIELPDLPAMTSLSILARGNTPNLNSIKIGNMPLCTKIEYVAQSVPSINSIEIGDLPLITASTQIDLYIPPLREGSTKYYVAPTLKHIKIGDMVGLTNAYQLFYKIRKNEFYDTTTTGVSYTNVESITLGSMPNITNAGSMFNSCNELKEIPDISVDYVTNANNICQNCTKAETGILRLYNKLSALPTTPTHSSAFRNCGSESATGAGAAELEQIPSDWK